MVFQLLSAMPGLKRFGRDPTIVVARRMYNQIVAQAREPAFYTDIEVPDTLVGRFEMVALHAFVVMRRLKSGDAADRRLSQALFDVMFADMDDSLREDGVGDMKIGKKVRGLAEDFFGRVAQYDRALDAKDHTALADALARNVFETSDPATAESLARYVTNCDAVLRDTSDQDLRGGTLLFPSIEKVIAS